MRKWNSKYKNEIRNKEIKFGNRYSKSEIQKSKIEIGISKIVYFISYTKEISDDERTQGSTDN